MILGDLATRYSYPAWCNDTIPVEVTNIENTARGFIHRSYYDVNNPWAIRQGSLWVVYTRKGGGTGGEGGKVGWWGERREDMLNCGGPYHCA